MKTQTLNSLVAGVVLFVALGLLLPRPAAAVEIWSVRPLTAPGSVNLMLLLSDGTVMGANNADQRGQTGNAWYQLLSHQNGTYELGHWNTLQSMQYTRLFNSSAVLTNGSVLVAGGEYGTGWGTAELYNPVINTGLIWITMEGHRTAVTVSRSVHWLSGQTPFRVVATSSSKPLAQVPKP
jgi:hypothetical protein